MDTDLDKQLEDAKKEMEKAQAKRDALKAQVILLMQGVPGKEGLAQRLFNLEQVSEELNCLTVEKALDAILQQVKDAIMGQMAEAKKVREEYITPNIEFVVKQQKKYNDLVGPDERVETLDDEITKLREEEKSKKPKLGEEIRGSM